MTNRCLLFCFACLTSLCFHDPLIAQKKGPRILMAINSPTCKSAAECHDLLETGGWGITPDADFLLDKVDNYQATDPTRPAIIGIVMLYTVTVRDLGFPDGATFDAICQRAQDFNLEVCLSSDGPDLCLHYSCVRDRDGYILTLSKEPTEMENEVLFIAMRPLIGTDGKAQIFMLVPPEAVRSTNRKGFLATSPARRIARDGEEYVLKGSATFVFRKYPK